MDALKERHAINQESLSNNEWKFSEILADL